MDIMGVLTSPGIYIIAFFALCGTIIHYRGQRRFKFSRQIFDHSTFMAPINLLMYAFSSVQNKPYLPLKEVPELDLLTKNWEILKVEALNLNKNQTIKGSDKYNDIGFNSFFRRGWKRFYLKWYSKDFHPSSIDQCPRTIELLKQTPSVKAAMFVVLPAGSKLPKHRDPYAGSLRYHLGLETPNSEDCFIDVDHQKYHWKDGEAVLFDETYLHHAENRTEQDRLIFFCDVRRPMKNRVGKWLNDFFSWFIVAAAKSPNDAGDKTGFLNRIFKYLYAQRIVGKKLKAYNERLYYTVKYVLYGLIIYWVFF